MTTTPDTFPRDHFHTLDGGATDVACSTLTHCPSICDCPIDGCDAHLENAADAAIQAIMDAPWAQEIVAGWPALDDQTRDKCARILLGDFDTTPKADA